MVAPATLTAAGVMTLPLLAMGVDHLTAVQWIIGLVAGGLAYTAVLLITRELSPDELRSVLARSARALPRPAPSRSQRTRSR